MVGTDFESAFDFPLSFGFDQSAPRRVGIRFLEERSDLPGAELEPVLPDAIDWIVGTRFFDHAAKFLEWSKCAPAQIEHPRLEGQVAAEITKPCQACALGLAFERLAELRWVLTIRQRHASVIARHHRERRARSGRLRAIGPCTESDGVKTSRQSAGTRPKEVRNPKTLLNAAGLRNEPA